MGIIAIKITATNDGNGNPRRGWIIVNEEGSAVDFIDEGYRGWGALREAYPQATEGPAVELRPGSYREWKREFNK